MTEKTIVQKVKEGITGVAIGYFDTGISCSFDDYYKYFNDEDKETRKYSILFFTIVLGNWYSKSSFVFKSKKELLALHFKYGNVIGGQHYNFENYISSFLDSYQSIEKEFPYMFEIIVIRLILIEEDKGLCYEEWFAEIDSALFKELREKILIPNSNFVQNGHPIKYLFREVGIEPFFLNDFFEE
ncbi:MAG: hypothetical protein RR651_14230 [Lysinibacillus sp.]